MAETNWKKLKTTDMRSPNYSDGVIDAIENGLVTTSEAKAFLNTDNKAYGLILTKLEDSLKEAFQKHTGVVYPDHVNDGMERVAYEAICSFFENDKDTYGSSFNMFIGEENAKMEILVVTEKAIRAFGIDPSTLPEMDMDIDVQSEPTPNKPEPPPLVDVPETHRPPEV